MTTSLPKVAVLFPGQGAQKPGMGLELAQAYPFTAGEVYRTADRILGYSLARLVEGATPELLARTDVTQPALVAAELAAWRALQAELPRLRPACAAGLSLGEYAALAAAGFMDVETTLRLVTWRGRFMETAALRHPGGMSAIIGLDREVVEEACAAIAAPGLRVLVANYNAPGQYVISGEAAAVEEVGGRCASAGAKVVPLRVNGPYHTPFMRDAARRLSGLLTGTRWQKGLFPVYSNVTGRPYRGRDGRPSLADLAGGLERQVTSSVRWEETIRHMARSGIGLFLEVGPGRTLASLVRRILPEATVIGVSDRASLARAAAELKPYALEVVS